MSGKSIFDDPDRPGDDDDWGEGLGAFNSAQSYRELAESGKLGEAQQRAFFALADHEPCTAGELAAKMEPTSVNANTGLKISSRLDELFKKGWVKKDHSRPCGATGKLAIVWTIAPWPPVAPPKRHTADAWALIQRGEAVDCVLSDQPPQEDGETWVRAQVVWYA